MVHHNFYSVSKNLGLQQNFVCQKGNTVQNCHASLREIVGELDISDPLIRLILVYILGVRCCFARVVPIYLNLIKKECRE